jgi:predicted secreted Zn-dependent protease
MTARFGDVERVSYDVSALTLQEVAAAIAHLPEAGSAEWFPHYDFNSDERDVVTEATVTVGWRITLPNWDGYRSARQPEQDEWDRFLAALGAHEQGHLDLATQHLSDVDEHMVGLSAQQAVGAFDQALQQLQAASNTYDQSTDHGRNSGTIIDLDVAGDGHQL